MEAISVNALERDKAINKAVTEAISEIKLNTVNGVSVTEFYFPKEIGSTVKSKVSELLTDSKTRFNWCVVRTGTNQYTGRIEHFISETIGDTRRFKLKIL